MPDWLALAAQPEQRSFHGAAFCYLDWGVLPGLATAGQFTQWYKRCLEDPTRARWLAFVHDADRPYKSVSITAEGADVTHWDGRVEHVHRQQPPSREPIVMRLPVLEETIPAKAAPRAEATARATHPKAAANQSRRIVAVLAGCPDALSAGGVLERLRHRWPGEYDDATLHSVACLMLALEKRGEIARAGRGLYLSPRQRQAVG
jgi:hypothetical protein